MEQKIKKKKKKKRLEIPLHLWSLPPYPTFPVRFLLLFLCKPPPINPNRPHYTLTAQCNLVNLLTSITPNFNVAVFHWIGPLTAGDE